MNRLLKYAIVGIPVLALLVLNCVRTSQTFASLDPQNEYVGVQACQSCHAKITKTYLETGMGKSMYAPPKADRIESEGLVYDEELDFYYQPLWRGKEFFIREFRLRGKDTIHSRMEKIDYVVGSGHQTRSYLIQRNGYIYEAPITWYVNKGIWDLSPGYEGNNSRFDREIGLDCVACHTGHVDFVEGSKNRYTFISEGIDCEKCHGPGAIHIEKIEGGQLIDVGVETDYSIVNPAKLPIQEQFDLCQQCHLQGVNVLDENKRMEDFRPAMKLKELGHVFVEQDPDQNAFGIASHAQRLQLSSCFLESSGKMNCTTCHDPHKSIAVTEKETYVKQCQSCHQQGMQKLCTESSELRMVKEDNCISCHMPSGGTNDIPHVSFHDHYIRVVKVEERLSDDQKEGIIQLICATDSAPSKAIEALAWLNYYETQRRDSAYLDQVKAGLNALAPSDLARFYILQGNDKQAQIQLNKIPQGEKTEEISFLEGEVLEGLGQFDKAYDVYWALYQENKERWDAGLKAGVNLLKAQQGNMDALYQAEKIFAELAQAKPFDVRVLNNQAFIYLNRRNLRNAERILVKVLNLDPDNLKGLENMVLLQRINRNKVQEKLYMDRLIQKYPTYHGIASP
ncbi:MAG: cytochrome c3 family protein [Bacteroidota bacterium]